MATYSSFLEVKTGSDCTVCIGNDTYDLGSVKAIYATHREYIVWFSDDGQIWYEIDHNKVTLRDHVHNSV
jgi:spore maturation protein CgeB